MARGTVLLAAIVGFGTYLYSNIDELRGANLTLRWTYAASSFALLFIYLSGRVLVWQYITKVFGIAIPLQRATVSWFTSLLGKYLPGKVFYLLARIYFYSEAGHSKARATVAFAVESLSTMLASVLTVLIALMVSDIDIPYQARAGLLAAMVLFTASLHPRVLQPTLDRIFRLLHRRPLALDLDYWTILRIVGLHVVNWLVFGLAFYFLIQAVHRVDAQYIIYLAGAISLASLLGILALVAPSGIGIREGVLTLLLLEVSSAPVAALLAVVARAWVTLGEAIAVCLAFLLSRRSPLRVLQRSSRPLEGDRPAPPPPV